LKKSRDTKHIPDPEHILDFGGLKLACPTKGQLLGEVKRN